MGSSSTKPQKTQPQYIPQNSEIWEKIKQRQINKQEMTELGQKVNQPFSQIERVVKYLEKKGIIIENGLLGVGGCGFVLKACNEQNNNLAVKLMKYQNLDQFERNKKEYDILKQFKSGSITKVYQFFTESHNSINYQFIVMERCFYDLLYYISKKITQKSLMTHQNLYSLCLELCQGLHELQSKNIIHLDIKPGNILLGFDLKWKYTDLGISKVLLENKQHTESLIGFTPTYSSPEQYQLMNKCATPIITKSSDIYSLGVVFLQLTGVDVSKKWVIKQKISSENYDDYLNPYYQQFNDCIIKKMMQYQADKRLSIEEVINTLKDLLNQKNKPNNSNNQNTQEKSIEQEQSKENEEQNISSAQKLNEQNNQESGQKDQIEDQEVNKGKRRRKIRSIPNNFNLEDKLKNNLKSKQIQLSIPFIISPRQQIELNPSQNENNIIKPNQNDNVRNSQSKLLQLQNEFNNSNRQNKLEVKLPQITSSYLSTEGNVKDNQKKFIGCLKNIDQFFDNNYENKPQIKLPQIIELKSLMIQKNNNQGSQQIRQKKGIQSQKYIDIIQQAQSFQIYQLKQYEFLQSHKQILFGSSDKQIKSYKIFVSQGQYHAKIDDQRQKYFNNHLNTPFKEGGQYAF